jgi:drug/metabolite transporter (DMT)-like permease
MEIPYYGETLALTTAVIWSIAVILFLKERITRYKVAGIILAVIGVFLVILG